MLNNLLVHKEWHCFYRSNSFKLVWHDIEICEDYKAFLALKRSLQHHLHTTYSTHENPSCINIHNVHHNITAVVHQEEITGFLSFLMEVESVVARYRKYNPVYQPCGEGEYGDEQKFWKNTLN